MGNNLKQYIKSIVKEIIDEESESGDVGAFSTPYAFKKPKENIQEIINTVVLNELSYGKFKNEIKVRSRSEQLHKAIREVKRKITEIDRIVEYTSRMKQELSESEEGRPYWKRTEESIQNIKEMLNTVTEKLSNL